MAATPSCRMSLITRSRTGSPTWLSLLATESRKATSMAVPAGMVTVTGSGGGGGGVGRSTRGAPCGAAGAAGGGGAGARVCVGGAGAWVCVEEGGGGAGGAVAATVGDDSTPSVDAGGPHATTATTARASTSSLRIFVEFMVSSSIVKKARDSGASTLTGNLVSAPPRRQVGGGTATIRPPVRVFYARELPVRSRDRLSPLGATAARGWPG